MIFGYSCPRCRKELCGNGQFGQASTCECGMPLSANLLDKARRYWILQCSFPYGIATFLIALAFFHASLPDDPWERLLSPILISPSIASIIVVYRILTKHKKFSDADNLVFKFYKIGMCLIGISIIVALTAQTFWSFNQSLCFHPCFAKYWLNPMGHGRPLLGGFQFEW